MSSSFVKFRCQNVSVVYMSALALRRRLREKTEKAEKMRRKNCEIRKMESTVDDSKGFKG